MPIEFEYVADDGKDEEIEVEEIDLEKDLEDEIEEDEEEELEEEDEFEEDEESEEFEEIEFSLTDEEIDEWINELMRLRNERKPISLQIDDDLFLKINPEEEKGKENEEEKEHDTKY